MDVESPFNVILGRPWITALNAVPSIAHQCLKFPYEGKLVKLHNVNLPEPDQEEKKLLVISTNEKSLLSFTDLTLLRTNKSPSPLKQSILTDG